MKRILIISLTLLTIFSFVGCNKNIKESNKELPVGYKNICWNMSKSEIKKLENPEYKREETADILEYSNLDMENPFIAWSLASQSIIKTTYTFKNNKLIEMKFVLEDDRITKDVAKDVYDSLAAKYGTPAEPYKIHYLNDNPESVPMIGMSTFKNNNSQIKFMSSFYNIKNDLTLTFTVNK